MNNNEIIAKKCGTITVSVYKTKDNHSFFYIKSDTDDASIVSDVIEDVLYSY